MTQPTVIVNPLASLDIGNINDTINLDSEIDLLVDEPPNEVDISRDSQKSATLNTSINKPEENKDNELKEKSESSEFEEPDDDSSDDYDAETESVASSQSK